MKKIFIATLILSSIALTACDNSANKRKEECTKAQNDMYNAFFTMKEDKSVGVAARKKWNDLNCQQSDVIHDKQQAPKSDTSHDTPRPPLTQDGKDWSKPWNDTPTDWK